ncbi:PIG-L family deacetylase [Hymenobacter sp. BT559]|uniref:PIG-L family deacetylase n=1 Tax=Hymenobacter sp. BT559 TaxID=2795729 RepID=UPI0018EAA83D|nr:PIG-L family deacetylase [Hymenobacter sp. BT559]MBJ6145518.1 PIG-L family deacetylase [Hymenobacter sp. BT559]
MLQFLRATRLALLSLVLAHCSLLIETKAQAPKTYTSSEILLGLKKLNVVGSVMYIAAHPDDENTRLLAYLANGRQLETSYLSCTRGDGGQDLIGPELREQLGVIRTQELLAARRIDGAHQYFSRANDFGFSKTSAETFTIWDKEQVLADMVWVIRQRRPDVLITRFPPDARAGHGHHQASAILAAEAFDAAGDPKRFPEQLTYVQAWQPKRLYWNTGSFFVKPGENMDGYLKLDAGGYNPLLGQSYGEIAAHSRSQHRSQGFGSAAQRGEAIEYFQFVKGTPAKTDLFEGIDQTWNRVPGGATIGKMVDEVVKKYDAANPSASVAGLLKVREAFNKPLADAQEWLEFKLKEPGTKASVPVKESAGTIAFYYKQKREQVDNLIQACLGLHIEAIASSAAIATGQTAVVTVEAVNQGVAPITVRQVWAEGFGRDTLVTKELRTGQTLRVALHLPISKQVPPSQPYWLREPGTIGMYTVPAELSFAQADLAVRKKSKTETWLTIDRQHLIGHPENLPSPNVTVELTVQGTPIYITVPVQYKHTDPVLGEQYQPLAVVPPVMVNIPAARAYVFADQQPKPVPVTLRAGQAGVKGQLALQVPSGWQAEPATAAFDLKNKDDEQTVTFNLRPLAGAAEGKTELRAVATVGADKYSRGIQQIVYPHIPTQTLFPEATAPLVRLNVARGHTKNIGYLMGAGDEVPEALRQLGYTVTLLDPATDLTADRLGQYDAVVLGVRAYNVLDRLKTQQAQLLKYVENGGTMLVQYVVNRGTVMSEIGPYPLTLSSDRVTVENTPVTFVPTPGGAVVVRQAPKASPKSAAPSLAQGLLAMPNKLTPADFSTGWVQEQGLYYPSAWDAHYQPVIASHDPGETEKQSAILVAPYGKGRYIYTGLSLFRELPAGVPGAYRILANLVESGGK